MMDIIKTWSARGPFHQNYNHVLLPSISTIIKMIMPITKKDIFRLSVNVIKLLLEEILTSPK